MKQVKLIFVFVFLMISISCFSEGLAVTPDADYKDWLEHKYPSNWLVGYDKNKTIYNQRLYDIQRLPCIYLLDKDKRVLLKEADYNRLVKCLPPF